MKKIAMVAAVKYSDSDGIFKKIVSQAKALSICRGQCKLFCLSENEVYEVTMQHGQEIGIKKYQNDNSKNLFNKSFNYILQIKQLLKIFLRSVNTNEFELVYIRHMIPNIALLRVLRILKKEQIKIVYEIPTYPYYYEQYNISKNKLKTIMKIVLETIYWPIIYINIDILCTVICNSKAKKFSKMMSIYNGIDSKTMLNSVDGIKNINSSKFEIIGVGTIYSYHGYDRIIRGMADCNCILENGKKIIFHIVGWSNEIEKLKKLANDLDVSDNVIFHGKQFGNSLDNIFKRCSLGVGTLALNIRKADIDTAIKNIEYLYRNIPVLTSGLVFDIDKASGLYKTVGENISINFDELYDFSKQFYEKNKTEEFKKVALKFEWINIIEKVIESIK